MNWHIRPSGAKSVTRPFSSEEIEESLARGIFSAEDAVQSAAAVATSKWTQLGDHDEFFISCTQARRRKSIKTNGYSGSYLVCFTDLTLLITAWFILTTGNHRLLQLLSLPEAAVFRESRSVGTSPTEDVLVLVSTDHVTIAGRDVAPDTPSIAQALSDTLAALQSGARFRLRIQASPDVSTEAVVRVIDAKGIAKVPWTDVIIE